jgi:hypothetical protein
MKKSTLIFNDEVNFQFSAKIEYLTVEAEETKKKSKAL